MNLPASDRIPEKLPAFELLHELRTPLSVVSGQIHLLRRQVDVDAGNPERIAARLEQMARATEEMAATLERFSAGAWQAF